MCPLLPLFLVIMERCSVGLPSRKQKDLVHHCTRPPSVYCHHGALMHREETMCGTIPDFSEVKPFWVILSHVAPFMHHFLVARLPKVVFPTAGVHPYHVEGCGLLEDAMANIATLAALEQGDQHLQVEKRNSPPRVLAQNLSPKIGDGRTIAPPPHTLFFLRPLAAWLLVFLGI